MPDTMHSAGPFTVIDEVCGEAGKPRSAVIHSNTDDDDDTGHIVAQLEPTNPNYEADSRLLQMSPEILAALATCPEFLFKIADRIEAVGSVTVVKTSGINGETETVETTYVTESRAVSVLMRNKARHLLKWLAASGLIQNEE